MSDIVTNAAIMSVVGLVIVFTVLAMLTTFVHFLRKLDDAWLAKEKVSEAHATERDPTIDSTTLVVIASAVATVVRGRFAVRRIRRLAPLESQRASWSQQGRAVLHGSHVIVKRPGEDGR